MERIPGVRFPESNRISGNEEEQIDRILHSSGLDGFQYDMAESIFKNRDFFNALPEGWRNNVDLIASYIVNSSRFNSIVSEERQKIWAGVRDGLFTDEVVASQGVLPDGSTRRVESGYALNVDYLRLKGIDASKVLFYRRTQPSESVKPELYWTSDFHETLSGLTSEIRGDAREKSIVLVLDLETLAALGQGLIQDINDDEGVSVRTVGTGEIDQKSILFSIKNPRS